MTTTDRQPAVRPSLAPWRPVAVDDLIRLGHDEDGGYVVSRRSVEATHSLLAFGINDEWSFETAFAARVPDASIVAVDGSVSHAIFRERARAAMWQALGHAVRLQRWHMRDRIKNASHWRMIARRFGEFVSAPNRTFHKRFIGAGPGMIRWRDVIASVPVGTSPDVFIKMDIEGAEYDVLPDIIRDAGCIAGMAIEFHSCGARWDDFASAMNALSGPLAVVHMHGNNHAPLIPDSNVPDALEVTLVNRALLPATLLPSMVTYPRPEVDRPNDVRKADHPLVFS